MCGIIGFIGNWPREEIWASFKKNETRGGHAWGIAYFQQNKFTVKKAPGRIPQEIQIPPQTEVMIGHTRWATNGKPELNENNHPHASANYAIIHNGVLDNKHNAQKTDCDSEYILKALISHEPKTENEMIKAIRKVTKRLEGSYRVAIITNHCPNTIFLFSDSGDPVYIGMVPQKGMISFGSEEKDLPKGIITFRTVSNKIYILRRKDSGRASIRMERNTKPQPRKWVKQWYEYRSTPQIWSVKNSVCQTCQAVLKNPAECVTCEMGNCNECIGNCSAINCNKFAAWGHSNV